MEKTNRPTTNPATSKENTMTTINTDASLSKADRDIFTARAAAMTAEELVNKIDALRTYGDLDTTTRIANLIGIYENELTAKTEPKTYTEAELRDIYCVETASEEFDRENGLTSYADLVNPF